jgi:BASS family bile acid:Na+ symporter
MPHWVLIAAQAGVTLAVLALGLSASFYDAAFVIRSPKKLARAVLSMNVIAPLFTVAMVASFHLRRAVAVALVALAVSPIPPILPRRALKAGGGAAYTIGLLVAASLLAIAVVPLTIHLVAKTFERDVSVSPSAVARVVAVSVLAPLAIGMLLHRLRPRLADRIARPTSIIGLVVIAVACVPLFAGAFPEMLRLIGNGTLAAIIAFNVVGLAVGHLLGGPSREERTVLALTTASRHPGVALVVATGNFGEPKSVVAALLLYLIVNVLVAVPYARWSRRRAPAPAHGVAA